MKKPIITADKAISLIRNGDTIAIEGSGGGIGEPELMLRTLKDHFNQTGYPQDLTIIHSTGMGDRGEKGLSLIALEGMIRRVIGGHFGQSPAMAKLVEENKIEAYNFPIGVICQLYREIAAKRPGVITHIGMHTFIDPRQQGGKLNEITEEDLIEIIHLSGKEYLFYRSFPINIAIIRASTADEEGYLSVENEPAKLALLAMAQAAKNSGGITIAQVKNVTAAGSINPHRVVVPGTLVDYIVLDPEQQQTYESEYNPAYCGSVKTPIYFENEIQLTIRKIIARRAALEITPNAIVNLGVGISDMVATVSSEENISDEFTLTVEQGAYGGVPQTGILFGTSINPKAIVDSPSQFDYYDGGGLDIAFLGMAQADREGNVNVSKFNQRVIGTGGFVDISQGAQTVIFCSTFTTKNLEVSTHNGKIKIVNEGQFMKFLNRVEHITYSGKFGNDSGQRVLYVTERAVFQLVDHQLVLIEIAEGVNLERHILQQMEFIPVISRDLKFMDNRIFKSDRMGLEFGFPRMIL